MAWRARQSASEGNDGAAADGRRACSSFLALVVMLVSALASGCSHTVLVRTVPEDATVTVDGEEKGKSPVVVETRSGAFDTMSVTAELEGFATKRVLVEQSEWFLWPALLAVTPFIALPLVVVFPPVGAIIAAVWFVVTSPTFLSLAFVRSYPDEVVIELVPRQSDASLEFLPTDWWTTPEEYAPNPLPPLLDDARGVDAHDDDARADDTHDDDEGERPPSSESVPIP